MGVILGLVALGYWLRTRPPPGGGSLPPARDNILLVTLDTMRADRLGCVRIRAGPHAPPGQTGERRRPLRVGVQPGAYHAAGACVDPHRPLPLRARRPQQRELLPARPVRDAAGRPAPPPATARLRSSVRSCSIAGTAWRAASRATTIACRARRARSSALEAERRGDRTALVLSRWLDEHAVAGSTAIDGSSGRAPFFVWLHLYDPHEPYRAPPPFGPAFTDSPYDGEVAFTDAIVASILDKLSALGLLSSTIVAVIGDHGESLGDHGEETHSMFVYDSAVRVPFLLWRPGRLPAGLVIRQPVRAIDLPWTLAELVGVPPPKTPHSRSLVPLIEGRGGQASEPVYAETYLPELYMNWAPLRALRDDRWKLIDAPRPELYDLATDAGETQNLYDREPQTAAAIRRALDRLAGEQDAASQGRDARPRDARQAGSARLRRRRGRAGAARGGPDTGRSERHDRPLQPAAAGQQRGARSAFFGGAAGPAGRAARRPEKCVCDARARQRVPRHGAVHPRHRCSIGVPRAGADERKRAPVDRDLPCPARAAGPGTAGSRSGPGDRSPLRRRTHPARGHSRRAGGNTKRPSPTFSRLSHRIRQADDQARSREGPGRGRPPG